MAFLNHLMGLGVSSAIGCEAIAGGGKIGVVATGTTSADAVAITSPWATITTSAGSTGVILPKMDGGFGGLLNESGQTITVYPPSGTTFNAAATSFTFTNLKVLFYFWTSPTTMAIGMLA